MVRRKRPDRVERTSAFRTGKVDGAYRKLQQQQHDEQKRLAAQPVAGRHRFIVIDPSWRSRSPWSPTARVMVRGDVPPSSTTVHSLPTPACACPGSTCEHSASHALRDAPHASRASRGEAHTFAA
jgi:hypothetical protein